MPEQDANHLGREGMVMVYDHQGTYLGCMGIETWREMLAKEPRPCTCGPRDDCSHHRSLDDEVEWLRDAGKIAARDETRRFRGRSASSRSDCEFIEKGDHYDCAHAGGGRGSPLTDWCRPCLVALVGTLQQERDAERRWCKHWAERAEAAEAELVKRPTLEEAVANVNFWKDKAVAAEAALAAGDQGERLDGTGRVAPADGCAERQSTADPSPAARAEPDTPADNQEDKT